MTVASPYSRVLVVHGFGASIDDHWFPWLADAVGAERLALPHSVAPRFDEWVPLVVDAIGALSPDTAVVAHSLGCVTTAQAVRRLAGSDAPLGLFVAVAPFAAPLAPIGDPDLDAFIADGLDEFVDIDLAAVRPSVGRTEVIRSDNDPIVPAAASDAFAAALDAPVHVLPGAGHFLAREGVDRLQLVADLLNLS